jgi:octanoyl-[GcvH]:protein N-octanoyltransferase
VKPLQVVRDSFPERPAFDTAVSRAVLLRVAAGELPETLRVARPGAMVAFGKQDTNAVGYAEAVRAAREGGFEAVERLAGGRAAVFHERTVALAWALAVPDALAGTHERFRDVAALVAAALARLGVDARIGEIAGEYCPGDYSVNAGGRVKLVGIGQRVLSGAAHIGGVVVVGDSARLREILVPVYEALELEWDPATAGSLEDELGETSIDDVEGVLLAELGERYAIEQAGFDAQTLALAARLESSHRSPIV